MTSGLNCITIKWWWNIPIFLLLVGLISLGIRSIITDDNRYGWGTFSKQVNFDIEYYWILENGGAIPHFTGTELRGKAFKKLANNNTRNSIGAVKSWVQAYTKYIYKNKKIENAKTFKALIYYDFNLNRKKRFDKRNKKTLIIQYPEN